MIMLLRYVVVKKKKDSMCTLKYHKKARDPFDLVVLFVRRIMHMGFLFVTPFYVQEFYCILLVRFYDFYLHFTMETNAFLSIRKWDFV